MGGHKETIDLQEVSNKEPSFLLETNETKLGKKCLLRRETFEIGWIMMRNPMMGSRPVILLLRKLGFLVNLQLSYPS